MAEIDVTLVSDDQLIDVPLATVFGTGIASIEQTVTSEDPDIPNEITCTLTNGTQTKFYIRNGDGDSPTITIEQAAEGYEITVVDKDGVHTSSILVDSTLDAESANPIQNGAVAGAVTQLTSDITAMQTSVGEAVKYTTQSLTEAQKTQARSNIDVPSVSQLTTLSNDVVRISAQSLTDAQKAQVRSNIGLTGGDGIFWVTIGTTTGTEILNAVTNGQYPVIKYDESGVNWFLTPSVYYTLNGTLARVIFEGEVGGEYRQVRLEGDTTWSAVVSDELVTSVNGMTGAATDEQVTTSVNAWLDAHPEATTTVEDGSITQKKLAFDAVEGEMSPNLIDKSKVTSARFTNTSGNIQSFPEGNSYYNYWRMTDYIDVHDHVGEQIIVANRNGYCFYTEEKTAIAGSGESLGMNYPANSSFEPFAIPEGAYYARLVYWYADNEVLSPRANFGESLLDYIEYGAVLLPEKSVYNINIAEKISLDNFEHDVFAEKIVSNNLVPPTNIKKDYEFNRNTGEEVSVASGYYHALTDFIPVKENTEYCVLCTGNYIGCYDADKTYIRYISKNAVITTPSKCAYLRLVVDSRSFTDYNYTNQFYLVEGNTRPNKITPYGSYIPKKDFELFSTYKSVLNRMHSLFDPTVKTAIGVFGDSNTAGLSSGKSGTYYEDCWANLFCNRIETIYGKDVDIYPFGKYGSWYGQVYSDSIIIGTGNGAFASLDFYGSTLKINFGQVNKGVASISIDGGSPVSYDTNNGTQYIADGLTEDNHNVVITSTSGNVVVVSITVHKYVTATNRGVTGSGSSSLPTNDKDYDIYLAVLGTNDRSRTTNFITNYYMAFALAQMKRGAEVIPITPTPATDTFETGETAGIKMAEVESAISKVCGACNLEHISFYSYLLNYCTFTGTELDSLFNDTLHLTLNAHKLIYRFMCDKFGLGQPVDDYLPS